VDPESFLPASAEISIALLGFAAIASIFRGGSGSWRPDARFWTMLALAAVAFTASLLPLPLLAADLEEGVVWGTSSSLLALGIVGLLWLMYRITRLNLVAGTPTNPYVVAPFMFLFLAALGLAVLNCGLFISPIFWPYIAALVVLQLATVLTFIRLLVVWLPRE
jgi:hypothetical protein